MTTVGTLEEIVAALISILDIDPRCGATLRGIVVNRSDRAGVVCGRV